MEMQQVRYFVTLAATLNFTRAAERCNVAQPALTRAIRALEGELGGELIRREGRSTHLTDLGRRMLPLLSQCYESATAAKAQALSLQRGGRSTFAVGVSNSINLALLGDVFVELVRALPGVQLRLHRGDCEQLLELMKAGDVELAVGETFSERWDRLDVWPLFSESYAAFISRDHPLAGEESELNASDLQAAGFFRLAGDADEAETESFAAAGLSTEGVHHVDAANDLQFMITATRRAGLAPSSALCGGSLVRRPIRGLSLQRTVAAHAVSGRPRSREAGAFLSLVRTAPWTQTLGQRAA